MTMAEPAEKLTDDFSAGKDSPPPSEGFDSSAFESAAARTRRGAAHDQGNYGIPTINSPEEAEKLRPGQQFKGPDGSLRSVPYKVMAPEDLNNVPDGADFVGPDGELRQKPKYESVDFTAQYLYNVAHSDKGRRKALERSYPGKVRDDPSGGFFVEDDDGVLRKPGRGAAASGGGIASAAAPTALGIGGAVGGGVFGGLPGVAGAFAGGAAGSKVNDIVASLAGVYDDENATRDALIEGGLSAGGQVAGKVIGAGARVIGDAVTSGKKVLPTLANKFLGVDPEKLKIAREMAERGAKPGEGPIGSFFEEPGTMVPPSQIFSEAPRLRNAVEVKEAAMYARDADQPLRQSAEAHYERSVGEILEGLGVGKPMSRTEIDKTFKELVAAQDAGNTPLVNKLEDVLSKANARSATHPDAAVSVEAAGQRLLESTRAKSAESDQRLRELLDLRRSDAERRAAVGGEAHAARTAELNQAQEESQRAAQGLIDQGFVDLDRQSTDALRIARAGHNSGDLWRSVGEQLNAYRTGIQARARTMYDTADELSGAVRNPATGMMEGGAQPELGNLAQRAQAFLEQLPEEFEKNHPNIVARIRNMASKQDEKVYDMLADIRGQDPYGEVIKADTPTWSQLHDLRTQLRQNIKWNDLTSDVNNGTYKYFQSRLDEILHAGGTSELKEASEALKRADAFYRTNMGPLENRQIQAVADGLKSGLTADPKSLLDLILKDGRTEVAKKIESIVGENTWNALRAADTQEMIQSSRDLNGAIDGKKFAREVLKRQNQGLLGTLHGPAAERIVEQARRIEQLAGRLNIQAVPGDTANDIIMRARAAETAAREQAQQDPLKTLRGEMAGIQKTHAAEMKAARAANPISFMLDPTVGAHEAVDRILKSPDMLMAAARAFPGAEASPEFELIRQVYAQRFLRSDIHGLSAKLTEKSMTPEIQALMFPGVTLKQMHLLAKEMDMLRSDAAAGFGNSLMAQNIVEHPLGSATGFGKLAGPAKMIPGSTLTSGALLAKYYKLIRKISTSPTTLRWLEKGLTSSDPAGRTEARAALRQLAQQSGAIGAGAGAAAGAMGPGAAENE